MTTLLVCGSRSITDRKRVFDAIENTLAKHQVDMILTGGARGVDKIAMEYAMEKDIPRKAVLPDYPRYGRAAPLIRDDEMVDQADIILAIWDGNSGGTGYTINSARKAGKPVILK